MYKPHLGDRNKNFDGRYMAVLDYRTATDIDVIFDDDTVQLHVKFSDFKKGQVFQDKSVPNDDMIGKHLVNRDGREMVIIASQGDNVSVQFVDTGEVVHHNRLQDVVNGDVQISYETTTAEHVLFGDEKHRAQLDKQAAIRTERNNTYYNAVYLLQKYSRCMMVRPCSFGKTHIAFRILHRPEYKKCLFLYPRADESYWRKHLDKKIAFRTYNWLWRLSDDQIKNLDYDIVFMDECHRVGGDEEGRGAFVTFTQIKKMMTWHPKTHFLGATATDVRMDGIDVQKEVFLNHTCYPYTMDDAIEDGLLKRPYYFYCSYHMEEKIRDQAKKYRLVLTRDELEDIVHTEELQKIDARNMPAHIRKYCDIVLDHDTDYMQFIVYYLQIQEIEENKDKVVKWFQDAYPDHTVQATAVHSKSNITLKMLNSLKPQPGQKRIDLIFSCEILSEGYHSPYLTGLLMERKTRSLGKYEQMSGRILSCDSDKDVIIFDIVDNLHSDFILPQDQVSLDPVELSYINNDQLTYREVIRRYRKTAIDWSKSRRNTRIIKEQDQTLGIHDNDPFMPAAAPQPVMPVITEQEAEPIALGADEPIQPVHNIPSSTIECNTVPQNTVISSDHTTQRPVVDRPIARPIVISHTETPIIHAAPSDTNTNTSNADLRNIEDSTDDSGVAPGLYRNIRGHLYSQNVQTVYSLASVEEMIDCILKRRYRIEIESILEEWERTVGPYARYQSEDEVDPNSRSYKLLKTICAKYNQPVDVVVHYMVQKKENGVRFGLASDVWLHRCKSLT